MAYFKLNPFGVPVAAGTVVNATGVGTIWNSSAPTFSAAIGSCGAATVVDNTHANFVYTAPEFDCQDSIADSSSGFTALLNASSNSKLSDCVAWVTTDVLKRADITSSLNDAAVNIYTVLTRRVPFDELNYTSASYNVTIGQATYNLISLQPELYPPLNAISSIRMTYGPNNANNATSVRLRRSSTRLYDSIGYSNFNSRPSTYARWGTAIELNPPPDSATYLLRLRYFGKVIFDNPNPQNTIILIDNAWAELIKWELLYRAYFYLGMYDKAAMLVQPAMGPRQPSPKKAIMYETGIIPRLWNDLLTTISMKEAPDEDFNINPTVRNYSQLM